MDDAVVWSKDRLLRWPDFQAEFNPAALEDAHSAIRFRPTWTVDSDSRDDQIMFHVEGLVIHTEFLPLLSWVRPTESTERLLLHERGRFDLAELVRCEKTCILQKDFEKKLFPTRGKNEEQRRQFAKVDSGRMIALKLEDVMRAFEVRSAKYDKETDFGRDVSNQSRYAEMFARLRSV
ncbi:MAG: hypothetical protein D9C04_00185 [Nitrosopumilus sp. B06]|nr:MAG: hypothetical protein D9C04_00185 [Nitrosopumilus sp. B06]